MTLLQERDERRREARLRLWEATRQQLRAALAESLPGRRVWLFGSITHPGQFHADSDIDLALTEEPAGKSIFGLQAELENRLERPIDLVLLNETRLQEKIRREGEEWTT